jgi:hypothetical protein
LNERTVAGEVPVVPVPPQVVAEHDDEAEQLPREQHNQQFPGSQIAFEAALDRHREPSVSAV